MMWGLIEPSQRDSSFEHPKYTVKPVNNGQQKIDKTKILMTNGILMKVERIAECWNSFDLR